MNIRRINVAIGEVLSVGQKYRRRRIQPYPVDRRDVLRPPPSSVPPFADQQDLAYFLALLSLPLLSPQRSWFTRPESGPANPYLPRSDPRRKRLPLPREITRACGRRQAWRQSHQKSGHANYRDERTSVELIMARLM
jgi:hypothetical protein